MAPLRDARSGYLFKQFAFDPSNAGKQRGI